MDATPVVKTSMWQGCIAHGKNSTRQVAMFEGHDRCWHVHRSDRHWQEYKDTEASVQA